MKVQLSEGQSRLVDQVINKGLCVSCGACVGLCPYLDYFDGRVVVMDRCSADTWRCLKVCPIARYDEPSPVIIIPDAGLEGAIGSYKRVIIARATDDKIRDVAQYGGVVSALLIHALENGYLRAAVLTDKGDETSPQGVLARNSADILECAGSRYSASGGLAALNRAVKEGESHLGVVGLPCQMEALKRIALMEPDGDQRINSVILRIGLFCTWALEYRSLHTFLNGEKVNGCIKKFDIPPPPSELFEIWDKDGRREFLLSDIRPMIQKGCYLCPDMTAEYADVSIGTVEGNEGWNTVIIRTDIGERIVEEAIKDGHIESEILARESLDHLKTAAFNKKERARKAIEEGGSSS